MNENTVKKIREFNRYYTVWLNVMNKGYLETDFSWPESRVLFEIYVYCGISATELCEHLSMDKSYISRILAKFEKSGLIIRRFVPGSKGIKKIYLTETGINKAKQIDLSGDKQITEKLKGLDEEDCAKLCEAMALIEKILRENDKKNA